MRMKEIFSILPADDRAPFLLFRILPAADVSGDSPRPARQEGAAVGPLAARHAGHPRARELLPAHRRARSPALLARSSNPLFWHSCVGTLSIGKGISWLCRQWATLFCTYVLAAGSTGMA
jgi:hypothetical protein